MIKSARIQTLTNVPFFFCVTRRAMTIEKHLYGHSLNTLPLPSPNLFCINVRPESATFHPLPKEDSNNSKRDNRLPAAVLSFSHIPDIGNFIEIVTRLHGCNIDVSSFKLSVVDKKLQQATLSEREILDKLQQQPKHQSLWQWYVHTMLGGPSVRLLFPSSAADTV